MFCFFFFCYSRNNYLLEGWMFNCFMFFRLFRNMQHFSIVSNETMFICSIQTNHSSVHLFFFFFGENFSFVSHVGKFSSCSMFACFSSIYFCFVMSVHLFPINMETVVRTFDIY